MLNGVWCLCLSKLECLLSASRVEPFAVAWGCAGATVYKWNGTHTHIYCMCKCVHVVSLRKTQRCHSNTGQSILGRRDLGRGGGRHLGILTLWLWFSYRIFTHLTSHMSSSLSVFPFFIFSQSLSISRASLHLVAHSELWNHTEIQTIKHMAWLFTFLW